MPVVRTPDERLRELRDYPDAPHYLDMERMRLHYLDEGRGTPVTRSG